VVAGSVRRKAVLAETLKETWVGFQVGQEWDKVRRPSRPAGTNSQKFTIYSDFDVVNVRGHSLRRILCQAQDDREGLMLMEAQQKTRKREIVARTAAWTRQMLSREETAP
jgi:predicted HTH transcriptional regulator